MQNPKLADSVFLALANFSGQAAKAVDRLRMYGNDYSMAIVLEHTM